MAVPIHDIPDFAKKLASPCQTRRCKILNDYLKRNIAFAEEIECNVSGEDSQLMRFSAREDLVDEGQFLR